MTTPRPDHSSPITHHSSRGFTLVEMLVTTSLLALVGATTVASLSGGIRVWERANVFGVQQQSLLVALHRMRLDLENVRSFRPLPFEGDYESYAFASVSLPASSAEGAPELGRLGYFLNTRDHLLCRSFVPYRHLGRARLREQCQPLVERVTRVRFSYYGRVAADQPAAWSSRWELPHPPSAVKLELTVQGHRESTPYTALFSLANAPRTESGYESQQK